MSPRTRLHRQLKFRRCCNYLLVFDSGISGQVIATMIRYIGYNDMLQIFLTFAGQGPAGERLLVAVNYAPNQSQCLGLPFTDLDGSP